MTRTIGVIGGGQLARMMVPPAIELGIDIAVLAETANSSAAIAATVVGDYRDRDTVLSFAETVDVITFDHEHVPQEVLHALVERGIAVRPGPDALRYAHDKLLMRARLSELGLPVPDWASVVSAAGLTEFLASHGGRAVVKTPRGGYDGKGVRVVTAADEVADWLAAGEPVLVEERIEFRRELSQMLARRPSGEMMLWPVVESIQRDGVCAEVIAPAPGASDTLAAGAAQIATSIAENIGVTGVLAVELFETMDGRLLVNELALRPHNSGHWSIDGSMTSQFEQHVRAVLDLPLGSPECREAWGVMVNVFGGLADDRMPLALAAHRGVKVHGYGKQPRPGRKAGHVTAVGSDLDEVRERARAVAAFFEG